MIGFRNLNANPMLNMSVVKGIFEAIITTEPYSPTARANPRATPVSTAGIRGGKITRQVELTPDAATVPAFVKRVIHLGWEVQAELTLEDGHSFTVYLTREQYAYLNHLKAGRQVYVKPKDARAFATQGV
jgi:ABC-type sulfate/molybdate transport systems ATPase subunit